MVLFISDCFIPQALQRLSEWRNVIGSTALIVLANFMSTQHDIKTDSDRKDFADALLKKCAFVYGNITEDGELQDPFHSDLLIQVLAQHMSAGSAIKFPGGAKGALALATVAACIFTLPTHLTYFRVSDGTCTPSFCRWRHRHE